MSTYSISEGGAGGNANENIGIDYVADNTGTYGITFEILNNTLAYVVKPMQTVGVGGFTSGTVLDTGLQPGTNYQYVMNIFRYSTGALIATRYMYATTTNLTAPTFTSSFSANGTVGQYYSSNTTASGAWSVNFSSGDLPPGLSITDNGSSASLTGYPTTAGTYSFTMQAYSGISAYQSMTVTIGLPPNPSWGSVSLPNGKVGTYYSTSVTPSDTASISGNSTTAPGISTSVSGGSLLISGTPTTSGTYTVLATANGAAGTTAASLNTNLYIAPLLPPQWSDQLVSTTFVVGTAYSDSVTATNATAYSVITGALPTGVSLGTTTGVLSGTPTTKQTFSFAIRASNTDGNVTSQTFAGTTSAPPVWTDSTMADIYQGRSYTDGVAATSPISSSPTQYTITSGALPTGLALNASTGAVTGTTFSTGAYSFTITATNADGNTAQAFSGTIILAPYWTDNILSGFIKGVPYINGVAAANSPTYSVSTGALPDGITLTTGTGAVTGTPTGTVGTAYSFTITATNGLGSISQVFSGQVQPDLGGKFRVYSGSSWVDGELHVYDGTAWVAGQAYVYDGSNWIKTEY